MRNLIVKYSLLCVMLCCFQYLYAQQNVNIQDTISLGDYENKDDGYNEDDETSTLNSAIPNYPIDTTYYKKINEEKWNEIKKDKNFIYKKQEIIPPKNNNYKWADAIANFFNSTVLKFIMYTFVALAIVFILYHIFKNSEINFGRNRKKENYNYNETWENVESFTNWNKVLQEALAKEDYRLAFRIQYLEILQKLHLSSVINYKQEKTNWEYVHEASNTTFKNSFTMLTKYFDYVWYGEFELNAERYKYINAIYEQLKNDIGN